MMVADSIPVNSDESPLITNFLVVCMFIISTALLLNLVSMNLMNGSKPVPRWLHILLLDCIGPPVGFCQNSTTLSNSYWSELFTSRLPRKIECGLGFMIQRLQGQVTTAKNIQRCEKLVPVDESCISSSANDDLDSMIQENQHMKQILKRSAQESDEKFIRDFWRCFAQTADRVFVLIFTLGFSLVSFAMLMKGFSHQLELRSI